jgi:transcriptional regulator with XRE-family HTH domain
MIRKGVFTMLDARIVGKIIQRYREKKGVSQEVLSGLADIGRTHLSAIERGERKPTLETFFKISQALGVKASELFEAVENEIECK